MTTETNTKTIAAIVLAGGDGSRFKGKTNKLLTPIAGTPLILRTLQNVLDADYDRVILVTGAAHDLILPLVNALPLTVCYNSRWNEGQSTSMQCGLRVSDLSADAAAFILGDQPFIRADTLRQLNTAFRNDPERVTVPVYREQRGNPCIFPKKLFPELLAQSGDRGGRALLQSNPLNRIPVNDPGILRDIDQIEDLEEKHETEFLDC